VAFASQPKRDLDITGFVESLGEESEVGQHQLLLRVTDFHSIDREVVTEVFALLREHTTQP
jgi:hypothetical protein